MLILLQYSFVFFVYFFSIDPRLAKATAKELFKILKKLLQQAEKLGGFDKLIKAEGSQAKLKDMVKKGQLEELNVKAEE